MIGDRFPASQCHFYTATESHALNGRYHRFRCVAQLKRQTLQVVDHLVQDVPMSRSRRHPNGKQIRADAEIVSIVANHHRVEIIAQNVQRFMPQVDDIVVDGVHLGVEFVEQHPVAHVEQTGAVVARHFLARRVQILDDHDVFIHCQRLIRLGIPIVAASVLVETVAARRQHLFDPRRHFQTGRFHLLDSFGHAQHVPHLERPCFVSKAPAHGVVDVAQLVGDFLRHISGIGKAIKQDVAGIIGGAVVKFQEFTQPFAQILDFARGANGIKAGTATVDIIHCLWIERQEHPLPIDEILFVESLPRFVAQPFVFDHLVHENGRFLWL